MRFLAMTAALVIVCVGLYLALGWRAGTMDDIQPAAGDTITYNGTLIYRDRMALSDSARLQVQVIEYRTENVIAETTRNLNGAQVPVPFTLDVDADKFRKGELYYLRASLIEDGRPPRITPAIDVAPGEGSRDLGELLVEGPQIQPAPQAVVPDDVPDDAPLPDDGLPENLPDIIPDILPGEEPPTPDMHPAAPVQINSTDTTASPPAAIPFRDTKWKLTAINNEATLPESRAAITFGADGRVAGNGGCNHIGSTYKVEGKTLEINPAMISTMMACVPEGLGIQEQAFTRQLVESKTFTQDKNTLVLSTADGRTLTFAKAP